MLPSSVSSIVLEVLVQLKLSTKALSIENEKDGKMVATTEAAKGRKQDTVCSLQISLLSEGIIGIP